MKNNSAQSALSMAHEITGLLIRRALDDESAIASVTRGRDGITLATASGQRFWFRVEQVEPETTPCQVCGFNLNTPVGEHAAYHEAFVKAERAKLKLIPHHHKDSGEWCLDSAELSADGTCPQHCRELENPGDYRRAGELPADPFATFDTESSDG